MAGTEGWSRIVYSKDERGVILDSQVVGPDDETPEGFDESAEYESVVITPTEGAPVDESKITVTQEQADLRQTVDFIKDAADAQEGPSDPGGLEENPEALAAPEDGPQPGDEVVADDGSAEHDGGQTVDEVKDDADAQEGPSDPRGESSDDDEPKNSRRKANGK